MKSSNRSSCLVSPKTRRPLSLADNGILQTPEADEVFSVIDGIIHLIDSDRLGDIQRYEKKIFDEINIRGIPYFRNSLFRRIVIILRSVVRLESPNEFSPLKAAEMGGGEGYWAQQIKTEFQGAEVFVCDLSVEMLSSVPKYLGRICADVSGPIFEQGTMDLISFWVSLHHLSAEQREKSLRESVIALKQGGIFLVFEPNNSFFLRRLLYKASLRNDIYPDQREQALDFSEISGVCKKTG